VCVKKGTYATLSSGDFHRSFIPISPDGQGGFDELYGPFMSLSLANLSLRVWLRNRLMGRIIGSGRVCHGICMALPFTQQFQLSF
jgi:hypothetical protein